MQLWVSSLYNFLFSPLTFRCSRSTFQQLQTLNLSWHSSAFHNSSLSRIFLKRSLSKYFTHTFVLLVFKGHWRRKFLLPISKVPTNVITNMIIVPHQIIWLARYLDFFWLYFQISSAILKKLSLSPPSISFISGRYLILTSSVFCALDLLQ